MSRRGVPESRILGLRCTSLARIDKIGTLWKASLFGLECAPLGMVAPTHETGRASRMSRADEDPLSCCDGAMHLRSLEIPGLMLIRPGRLRDARGFFSETYSARVFLDHGIGATFVQDNHALSKDKGVVRGLHFQAPPRAQDKLIRVIQGAILDVAVDIRRGSPTYGRHVAVLLSAENWEQLWVPKGFAHGYHTLEPQTEVLYKVTDYYARECERGLAWDDPALLIDWRLASEAPILSERDRGLPTLAELPAYFSYPT